MKKLNAILSLALIATLLAHGGIMEYSMLTFWENPTVFHIVGGIAVLLICVHALVSVINLFFLHDGGSVAAYPKQNIQTIIQRITAILIVVMMHFHMTNWNFIVNHEALTSADKWMHAGTEVLFTLFVAVHIITSFGRALLTLGIVKEQKCKKRVDLITSIVMGVLGLAFIITIICFFGGPNI